MQEDIIPRAAGMKFALGGEDQPRPTPRVIQALGKKILNSKNQNIFKSILIKVLNIFLCPCGPSIGNHWANA